ncbi:MAG TPA: hypothetical protein P5121_19600 [Caldilineaceae bacterium]|nr:hypothetical protein [Caldilineaceae bacterium]
MFDLHKLLRRAGVALLLVMVFLLAACSRGGDNATSAGANAAGNNTTAQSGAGTGATGQFGQFSGAPFASAYLTNTYENALPTTMQLMLGTLMLEDGDQAVSPQEAGKLLPMWQALQSGSITNATERNALYKSIEGAMTPDQMQAIAEMKLTFTNMTDWTGAHGIEMPQGGGQFGQGRQNGGGNSPFAALSDEQRAELRNLAPEERVARLRELGIEVPQGGFGGGQSGAGSGNRGGTGGGNGQAGGGQPRGGRTNVLLTPLIELLTARAAE